MKKNHLYPMISILVILTFILTACTPAATKTPATLPTL